MYIYVHALSFFTFDLIVPLYFILLINRNNAGYAALVMKKQFASASYLQHCAQHIAPVFKLIRGRF